MYHTAVGIGASTVYQGSPVSPAYYDWNHEEDVIFKWLESSSCYNGEVATAAIMRPDGQKTLGSLQAAKDEDLLEFTIANIIPANMTTGYYVLEKVTAAATTDDPMDTYNYEGLRVATTEEVDKWLTKFYLN